MNVSTTSPPIDRLPIVRFAVTVDPTAPRLALRLWMNSVLMIVLSMPRPKSTFREPEGATRITLSVSPPMKKLLICGPEAGSMEGNVKRSVTSAMAVKLVALPPIRISPIWPVVMLPPTSETR